MIPFVAKNIAFGDIILAEFDKDDNQYHFEDFNTNSGNTTVRIFVYDDNIIEETRKWLHIKSCESEVLLVRNIIAVNIPKNILYGPIKLFLDQGERENKWTYEESCLEHSY
ncbi:DUF4265 domain-containing protein [Flavobacterium psychrotrophum]|uniref:DUF4265 domain-containing protein n=1 Tax=Flavobacterium psychrotrophum TaxID=2294119 RepID=UPI000E31C34A|nr:DUF4265 domain-containing protein [Flavobacterium psychrotrophum]